MPLRFLLGVPALTLGIVVIMPLAALALGVSFDDVVSSVTDREVLVAIGVSIGCAAAAVAFGLLFGVPAAYLLARRMVPWTGFWQAVFDLPVVIPHPIVGIGLLLIFARNRLVGSALQESLGLQVVSAVPGIVLAMLVVSCPYIVKAARDGFRAVPMPIERAARSLGATPTRVFFTISLPLAMRNIRSGALLAWARAVSEFGSIVILAYYPRTAPVLIWDRFSAYGLRAALAPSLILVGVCLVILLSLHYFERDSRTVQEIER